jgi:hypothetical protein
MERSQFPEKMDDGHIFRVVQMTGTFHQIKIQKNNEKDQIGNAQTQFR